MNASTGRAADDLVRATQALSSELSRAALLRRAMGLLLERFPATRAALVSVVDGVPTLEATATSGAIDVVARPFVDDDAPAATRVLRDPRPLRVDDGGKDPLLCVPLIAADGAVSGALCLEGALPFTDVHEALLGVVAGQLGISLDNARRHAALEEANGRLAAALEAAREGARQRSQFVAQTAHELRTPLNSIINLPSSVLEDFKPAEMIACGACRSIFEAEGDVVTPETACPECGAVATLAPREIVVFDGDGATAAKRLRSVTANGKRLLSVVNDLLDASKLDAGMMEIHAEHADVGALLRDVEETLGESAVTQGVRLAVRAPAAGTTLWCDTGRLLQVLTNLVANAIRFSDGRGTVELTYAHDDDAGTFAVRDEGIGIAPEHHEVIFESFRQVGDAETRRFGGTGLGLAICRKLVELHGGRIEVESVRGSGATFRVRIPRGKTRDDRSAGPSLEVPGGS